MGETQGDEGSPPVPSEAEGAAEPMTETTAAEPSTSTDGEAAGVPEEEDSKGSRSSVGAAAAVTGAAVAGVAGGIAVAARDTRRRILGRPIGKRSRVQRGASAVVDAAGTVVGKAQRPAGRLGSRLRRSSDD